MIAFLHGIIKDTAPQTVILDVNGISFVIQVPDERLFTMQQKIELAIHFHWNPEQGPHLFGFIDTWAKTAFTLIISCSGVGPKIGLAALQALSPMQFFQLILLADTKTLSSINGIGTKKAESIILQLKDKVTKLSLPELSSDAKGHVNLQVFKQISDALTSLNYSRGEISGALEYAKKQITSQKYSFDELLRKALSFLAKSA